MSDKLNKITTFLGQEEVMLQLSEECSELIQVLLKYRRATKGLTPKTIEQCQTDVIEELSDVLLNIEQLLYLNDDFKDEIKNVQEYKTNRWYKRLFENG